VADLRPRKELGNKNNVGATITRLRLERGMKQHELLAKMQVRGVDIGSSSLSDLEGQNREVRSKELFALADIFEVSIEELFQNKPDE
jgi:transcriptional regulator with XRE-family HTH domain